MVGIQVAGRVGTGSQKPQPCAKRWSDSIQPVAEAHRVLTQIGTDKNMNKTVLIVIGIACAVISAAGIMQFRPHNYSFSVIPDNSISYNLKIEEWGAPVNGLQCRITADKKSYKIGENITLTGELKNCADKHVSILSNKYFPFVFTSLVAQASNRPHFNWNPYAAKSLPEMQNRDFIPFPPGEKYKQWSLNAKAGESLHWWECRNSNEMFPPPFIGKGQYKIWFEYLVIYKEKGIDKVSPPIWLGTALSNIITINITD